MEIGQPEVGEMDIKRLQIFAADSEEEHAAVSLVSRIYTGVPSLEEGEVHKAPQVTTSHP